MISKMTISPGALGWLGQVYPAQTRISPYSTMGSDSVNQEDRDRLEGAGIIDGNGKAVEPFIEIAEMLAKVSSYCRIRLTTGGMQVEKSVFFYQDQCISLDQSPEGLVITYPSSSDALLEDLQYFTGASPIAHSGFSIEANPAEALAMGALVDLVRIHQLLAYAQDEQPQLVFSNEQILEAVNGPVRNSRRIVSYIRNLTNVHSSMSEAVLADSLPSLEAAECVGQREGGWTLIGEAERMAANFWIIDDVVHMQSGAENTEKKLAFSQWMCLQSGLHDRLYMDIGEGKLRMAVISAANLVEYMKHALSIPPDLF